VLLPPKPSVPGFMRNRRFATSGLKIKIGTSESKFPLKRRYANS
jgi:hypothetical protein